MNNSWPHYWIQNGWIYKQGLSIYINCYRKVLKKKILTTEPVIPGWPGDPIDPFSPAPPIVYIIKQQFLCINKY